MKWLKRLLLIMVLVSGTGLCTGLFAGRAQAYELPNPADFGGQGDIYTEVALRDPSGTTNTLDAEMVEVKFYFSPGQPKLVSVFDGCHRLDNNGQGYYEHDADPRSPQPGVGQPNQSNNCDDVLERRTLFEFYALDSAGNQKRGEPNVVLNGQNMASNWWTDFDLSFIDSDVSVLSGRQEVLMRAHFEDNGASAGYINAFRLGNASPEGFIGYAAGRSFAIQRRADRHGAGRPGYHYDEAYAIKFSQPCNDDSIQDRRISWRDADAGPGGNPQDNNVAFNLYRTNKLDPSIIQDVTYSIFGPGSSYMGTFTGQAIDNNAMGANRDDRYLVFQSEPGWVYNWVWGGIEENNGVFVNIPFDSGLAEAICDFPPGGGYDKARVSCTSLSGYVVDPDQNSRALRTRIFIDDPTVPIAGIRLVKELVANEAGPTGGDYPGGGVPGKHGFTVDVAAYQDGYSNKFLLQAMSVDKTGSDTGTWVTVETLAVGPCKPPDCGPLSLQDATTSTEISTPEPGEAFKANFGVNYIPGGSGRGVASANGDYIVERVALVPGAPVLGPTSVTYNEHNNMSTTTPPNLVINDPGIYSFRWNYRWYHQGGFAGQQYSLPTCEVQFKVSNKPYFKVYGSDVQAGGQFATSGMAACAAGVTNPEATIVGYSRDNGSTYRGASVQYAASALGTIYSFYSAAGRSSAPAPPNDLAFANTVPTKIFGGGSGQSTCLPDYYSKVTSPGVTPSAATLTDTIPNGAVNYTGDLHIKLSTPELPPATKAALYVDDDVIIDSDIIIPGGYANRDEVPSLFIIAKGNIYITGNVNHLDGVFIAQNPTVGKGTIYTCANATAGGSIKDSVPNSTDLYGACNKRLTVGGAFIARQVSLLRTNGTLERSDPAEDTAPNTASNNIAEVFSFNPLTYFGIPHPSLMVSCNICAYNAVTSLPPIL